MSTLLVARPKLSTLNLRVSFERIEREFEHVTERLAARGSLGLYEQIADPELCLRIDRAQETIDTYARQSRTMPVEGKQWKKSLQDYEASWMAAMRYIAERSISADAETIREGYSEQQANLSQ